MNLVLSCWALLTTQYNWALTSIHWTTQWWSTSDGCASNCQPNCHSILSNRIDQNRFSRTRKFEFHKNISFSFNISPGLLWSLLVSFLVFSGISLLIFLRSYLQSVTVLHCLCHSMTHRLGESQPHRCWRTRLVAHTMHGFAGKFWISNVFCFNFTLL